MSWILLINKILNIKINFKYTKQGKYNKEFKFKIYHFYIFKKYYFEHDNNNLYLLSCTFTYLLFNKINK